MPKTKTPAQERADGLKKGDVLRAYPLDDPTRSDLEVVARVDGGARIRVKNLSGQNAGKTRVIDNDPRQLSRYQLPERMRTRR